jgi:hypothetical protein
MYHFAIQLALCRPVKGSFQYKHNVKECITQDAEPWHLRRHRVFVDNLSELEEFEDFRVP